MLWIVNVRRARERGRRREKLLKNHIIKKCSPRRDMLCVRGATGAHHMDENSFILPALKVFFFVVVRFYVVFWSLPHDFNGVAVVGGWCGAGDDWRIFGGYVEMCGILIYSLLVDVRTAAAAKSTRIEEEFFYALVDQFRFSPFFIRHTKETSIIKKRKGSRKTLTFFCAHSKQKSLRVWWDLFWEVFDKFLVSSSSFSSCRWESNDGSD